MERVENGIANAANSVEILRICIVYRMRSRDETTNHGNCCRSTGSLKKARMAMQRVNERRTEAHQKAEETGDFSTIFIASEDIFKEELGFKRGFWVDLVEIYRQENLENATFLEGFDSLENVFTEKLKGGTLGIFYFQYISSFDEIIIEYLRLSFEFPEKNEEELLALFRESVKDRKTFITFP